jgi:hypothetical protein
MKRAIYLFCAVWCVGGCSGRAVTGVDGGELADARPVAADQVVVVADQSAPVVCEELSVAGQVALENDDNMKQPPSIAFDGERFAVLWHSQLPIVSSMNGELRFALVDREGKTGRPDGIEIAGNDATLSAPLLPTEEAYFTLHNDPARGKTVLRRFDAKGTSFSAQPLRQDIRHAALAPDPTGLAVLTAPGPSFFFIDPSVAEMSQPKPLITAEAMASVWLSRRTGGFAAALFSLNGTATMYLLNRDGDEVSRSRVRGDVESASFAAGPQGFIAAYARSSGDVEVTLFDASGEQMVDLQVGKTKPLSRKDTRRVAVVSNGSKYYVAYPKEVGGLGETYLLQMLDAAGEPEGPAIDLPDCLATASSISLAWGQNELGIATLDHTSGLPNSSVCVTVMRCQ